jgi:phosphonate transport system substrate-binding protein
MMSDSSSNPATGSAISPARLFVTLLVVLAAAGVAYWYGINSAGVPDQAESLEIYGLDRASENRLADAFTDANEDLLADVPTDPAEHLDPDVLVFSYLASEQEHYQEVWSEFLTLLSDRIGKPVEFRAFDSAEDQLRALHRGELHIAGVNTGSVPFAVNVCGFVPMCSLGDDGKLSKYTMQLIAHSDSPIREVSDLKNRRLTLTTSTSNSGWKAPLAILLQEFDMQPVRDFDVVYSNGHAESIKGIADKGYEVAAVASDEIALGIDRGIIREGDFKVIYTSQPFCNNVMGLSHRLKPELAAAIRDSMVAIPWADTRLAEEFASLDATQFVAVSFQDDLDMIRKIDNVTGKRHSADVLEQPSRTPAEPAPPTTSEEDESDATAAEEAVESDATAAEEEGESDATAAEEADESDAAAAEEADASDAAAAEEEDAEVAEEA